MKKLIQSIALTVLTITAGGFTLTTQAALVGAGGYTNSFGTQPAAADWSTVSVGASGGTITTVAGLDAAAQALAATSITAPLGSDATDPPAANALAAWCSSSFYVQTRPTGVDATYLMCTLVNNLGVNAIAATISYDFNRTAPVVEEVDMHRAFYSFSGAAGSWTQIPEFSPVSASRVSVTLNSIWTNGTPLYVLWADDNGSGTPDTSMQIDNFSVTVVPGNQTPVAINNSPQSQAVAELQPAVFSVGVSGFPPPSLQWYTNDVAVTGATNTIYNIASATLNLNGLNFKVIAQNVASNVTYMATSSVATLTVNADVVAPVLLGLVQAGNNQAAAAFSERLALASVTNVANYSITSAAGNLTISNAVLDASQSNIIFTVSAMSPGVTYTLTANGVTDLSAAANAIAANSQASFTAAIISYSDIGNPAIGGTLVPAGNGFNITAGGTGIAGTNDQFTFGYTQVSGDFDVKLRINSLSPTDPWARAGLMARETLAADSRFAATLAGPNIAGEFFESRATTAAAATIAGWFPVNYPYTWLRLSRAGNSFAGYGSLDGQVWTPLGNVTLALPTIIYLGYAVCSANAAQATTVQVRDYQSAAGGTVAAASFPREPLGPCTRKTALVFSEIMYHPKARADGKNLEYIELYNSASIWEDISGYRITGDIEYTFANGTIIQPGQFIVLAKNAADVQSEYGISGVLQYGLTTYTTNVVLGVTNVTTNSLNSLNNGGGVVQIRTKGGALQLDVNFSGKAPWPIEADGGGHSLVLARPSYGEGDVQAWAASDLIGGSPGKLDGIGPEPARNVVINEFLANSDAPVEDMIELYNRGATPVDISGCWLSDSVATNKFRIPDGTVLPPRGFISFTAITYTNYVPTNTSFALSSAGEQIVFVNSNQTRVLEAVAFDGQQNGVSMGRSPDGAPGFRRLTAVTAGTTNAPILESSIVINELMYSPISGNSDDEFVELYNRGTNTVNLGDWKFTAGIGFTFPANTMIAPGGYLVVAKNAAHLQTNYTGLTTNNTLGDYSGTLANGGERVALGAPEYKVTTNGSLQVVTNVDFYFDVNEVTYNKGGKWGTWANGGGSSLELIDSRADNRQPSNWADSDESAKSYWTSFEFTGTADNQNTGRGNGDSLQVIMLGTGECLIDDIEVRNSGNTNVVSNGSFETGLTGWTLQGDHDQSFIDSVGFSGNQSLHIKAGSRGDNGGNRIIQTLSFGGITGGTATMRAKARWVRGFPEVLLRLRGGGLEAFGRLPVPVNLGTPGARNSRAVTNAGPAIYDVAHFPILPQANDSVRVTARVTDPNGVSQFTLRYRVSTAPTTFNSVTMVDNGTGGDVTAGDGLFTATIPAQASGVLMGFHLFAADGTGVTNVFPANALSRTFPNDAPTHECVLRWGEVQMPGSFATYHLWITDWSPDGVNQRWNARHKLDNAPLDGTFIYNNYRVLYNCRPQYGGSPWHSGQMNGPINAGSRVDSVINFQDDDTLLGTTDFVLNTVGNPSGNTSSDLSGMAEQSSYEIFKGVGIHYNHRRYIHFFINGNQRSVTPGSGGIFATGNFIMEDSQQPNGDVVKEWNPQDPDGQIYKIEDWFEFLDDGLTQSNNDADLESRRTTVNGVPNVLKLSPYRFMWRKRSVSAADSANNYTNILTVIDIVSPAANPTISPLTDTMVKQFQQVVDVEQWFHILAVQHALGNWDSYGYARGKNCYTYRPNFGKFQLLTWDIDFTMGVGGNGSGQDLFDINDQRLASLMNTPETVRAYWRGLQDAINGPFNNTYMDPRLDARAAAFRANNVSYDPAVVNTIKSYIAARRAFILTQLPSAAFAITSSTNFTSSSNIVTLTGTAPVDVKFIEINGVSYAITWSGTRAAPTGWSLRLPMSATGSNNFTLIAYDRNNLVVTNTTRPLTVNFTGVIEDPATNIVINEIMSNPLTPDAEYVELFNRSTTFTFDLSGWTFSGLNYTFPEGATMGPRSFLVLTRDRIAFGNAYGAGVQVYDQFTGALQLDGETLALFKPGATSNAPPILVDKVRYEGALPWPGTASGYAGSSFQLIDSAQDNSRVGNWYSLAVPPVYTAAISTPASPRDGWRFFSSSGSIGSGDGGGQMRLLLFLNEPGSALIDDLSIVAGTNAAVGYNYVSDGNFEAPLVTSGVTNSWNFGTNYTNTVIVGDLVHAGTGGLKIVGASPGNANAPTYNRSIFQWLSPAPPISSTNTLSFWYWATNSATNLLIRVRNSSFITTGGSGTNINIFFSPSNYIAPVLIAAGTNTLSPGATNQNATSLPAFQNLWINEVQADNVSGILDGAAEHDPWIELYNPGPNPVSLDGLYLSPNYTNLTNWAFPAGHSLTGGEFRVVFCDGQPGQSVGTELHTSFRLPSSSGSIALSRLYAGGPAALNGPQVLSYLNYAGLHADRSYGSFPDGQPFDLQEFFYVTPRGTNNGRSGPLVVFINEWMAGNTNYLADPADNSYDDWFELYNPGTNAVDIAGYYLTDTVANMFKYKVPTNAAHIIPAHGYLLVWADNQTGQNTAGGVPRPDLHVNFQLSLTGEAIGLFAADGTQIDAVTFGPQTNDVSEGRFPDGGPNRYWMTTNRTPRAANFVPGVGNNAPALTAIGNRSLFIGQTLSFTALATDPDAGQLLGFSLDAGAPPEATIGSVSGVFSWTPGVVGTNAITVRVTDNGTPPLDDFETIVVRVQNIPGFATASLSGNDLTLAWDGVPGRTYRVQYKDDLNTVGWTDYGQPLTTTTELPLSVTLDITGAPQRYYRLATQ